MSPVGLPQPLSAAASVTLWVMVSVTVQPRLGRVRSAVSPAPEKDARTGRCCHRSARPRAGENDGPPREGGGPVRKAIGIRVYGRFIQNW